MAAFVSVEGLHKRYPTNGKWLESLVDVSLEAKEGEILSILGPSGCGKTTLLRIIAGLMPPTGGSVRVGGGLPEDFRKAAGIGFVFQKPLLFPWRSVLDNVLLGVEIRRGAATADDTAHARKLLDMLGLSGFHQAFPSQLSGGMLQRAALARALVLGPRLLLLDEPFSALDELTREQLWADYHRVWRGQKMTVLLVTHSTREAVFFGDRVLVMTPRPGKIRAVLQIGLSPARGQDILLSREYLEVCNEVRSKL